MGSTLASRLRVKISSSNLQSRKNSDIELQACDGNLFAWIMVYKLINSPSTYPSDRISACSCSFGSMGLTVGAAAVFFSFEEFFLPGIGEILTGNRTAVAHSTIFRRDTSNLRGLSSISRSPVILLAFDIGGIHSVEICRSKGVKGL